MKYRFDEEPPVLELSRRNLNFLLDKLNDPLSQRTIGSPIVNYGDPEIMVKAVEDVEHYANRPAGDMYMPSGDPWHRLIEQVKDSQHKACAYGTREGDGKTCDCKYIRLRMPNEPLQLRGESTGCCELRHAVQVLEALWIKETQED